MARSSVVPNWSRLHIYFPSTAGFRKIFFSLPSFQRFPSDSMSLMKTISFILLLSAVMLEGAPGRWDPQEGILTN